MIKNNLILFLKYPEPGKVKTRLGKSIGYQNASDIYSVFIKHLLSEFTDQNNYTVTVYYSPKGKESNLEILFGIKNMRPQKGKSLGEKLSNAFDESFASGFSNTIVIGSDCIEINNNDIEKAFKLLSGNHQTVLGPTPDGGYYLVGLSEKNYPVLFKDIDWSTERVFTQTMDKIKNAGINNKTLKYYRDIDEISDINSNVIKIIHNYKPELRIKINT